MSSYIAIDIGGTRLRAAVYPAEGLTADEVTRIHTQGDGEKPLERLIELIEDVWPKHAPVQAIGVVVPGPTDPFTGRVIEAPNIPGWENLPLKQILEERFGAPVALGNDANMAALAEWRYGAGKGHHHLLYLTISTGIGSGIIINDQLLLGAHGLAAELGHTTVLAEGPRCGCGQPGHLEALASGTATAGWVSEQIRQGVKSRLAEEGKITGKSISRAAEMGDALAIQALGRAGYFAGIALASFLHIFNPTAIIIGGGFSQSGALLLDPLRQALAQHVMAPQYLEDLLIAPALFGDEAGLVGAVALARGQYPILENA